MWSLCNLTSVGLDFLICKLLQVTWKINMIMSIKHLAQCQVHSKPQNTGNNCNNCYHDFGAYQVLSCLWAFACAPSPGKLLWAVHGCSFHSPFFLNSDGISSHGPWLIPSFLIKAAVPRSFATLYSCPSLSPVYCISWLQLKLYYLLFKTIDGLPRLKCKFFKNAFFCVFHHKFPEPRTRYK